MGGPKPKALIGIGGAQSIFKFFNNEPIDALLVKHAGISLAH
jgi:serine/threonine-protein kinase HipA